MSDEELTSTPQEIVNIAQEVTENLLPAKSKKLYNKAYENFLQWRLRKKIGSFSENVLLAYFNEMSAKFAPSTLWAEFSMLKSTLNIYQKIDISKYSKLHALLKRKSEGFKGKKSKTFSPAEVNQFITEAPDEVYLMTKVAVIFGIMGACRRKELHSLLFEHVQDLNGTLLVQVINTKNRIDRTFTITGQYYSICKKYIDLRPTSTSNKNFFIKYLNGRCTSQNVGINTFGDMGKTVAKHMKLNNPQLYTGHCFRRTSATLLIDAGGDITTLKRHGGWKSTQTAEGYVDNSLQSKLQVSKTIMESIQKETVNRPSTSTSCDVPPVTNTFINPSYNSTELPNPPSPTFTPNTETSSQPAVGEINLSQILKHTPVVISKNNIQNLHIHYHNK